jgi:heavy-metal-associated domain-containing protein
MTDNHAFVILKIYPNSSTGTANYKGIEEGIAGLIGVKNVQINHTTNSLKVGYDPELLNVETIREALAELQKSTSW